MASTLGTQRPGDGRAVGFNPRWLETLAIVRLGMGGVARKARCRGDAERGRREEPGNHAPRCTKKISGTITAAFRLSITKEIQVTPPAGQDVLCRHASRAAQHLRIVGIQETTNSQDEITLAPTGWQMFFNRTGLFLVPQHRSVEHVAALSYEQVAVVRMACSLSKRREDLRSLRR